MKFLILAIMAFSAEVYAVHPQIKQDASNNALNKTLCEHSEDIYFSAKLANDKIVSLCANSHESIDTGYVKYRYGTIDNMELEYPSDSNAPGDRFFRDFINEGSVVGDYFIFSISSYTYKVSLISGSCTLSVYLNEKEVFRQICVARSVMIGGGTSINRLYDHIEKFPLIK